MTSDSMNMKKVIERRPPEFGVKNALELELYGNGIKVIDEWSYVEDPDIRPRIRKYMGLSRTQWTVTATINEDK